MISFHSIFLIDFKFYSSIANIVFFPLPHIINKDFKNYDKKSNKYQYVLPTFVKIKTGWFYLCYRSSQKKR